LELKYNVFFSWKNPIPIFAFVGLVLANKQEDENEILSSDIRVLITKWIISFKLELTTSVV
jgi:hypothetical protein